MDGNVTAAGHIINGRNVNNSTKADGPTYIMDIDGNWKVLTDFVDAIKPLGVPEGSTAFNDPDINNPLLVVSY